MLAIAGTVPAVAAATVVGSRDVDVGTVSAPTAVVAAHGVPMPPAYTVTPSASTPHAAEAACPASS